MQQKVTCLLQSQAKRRGISPKVAMGCEVMLPKVTNNLVVLDTQLFRSACIARKGVCLSSYNMHSLWLLWHSLWAVWGMQRHPPYWKALREVNLH